MLARAVSIADLPVPRVSASVRSPARSLASRSLAAPLGPPVGAIPYLRSFPSALTEPAILAVTLARMPNSPHAETPGALL